VKELFSNRQSTNEHTALFQQNKRSYEETHKYEKEPE